MNQLKSKMISSKYNFNCVFAVLYFNPNDGIHPYYVGLIIISLIIAYAIYCYEYQEYKIRRAVAARKREMKKVGENKSTKLPK